MSIFSTDSMKKFLPDEIASEILVDVKKGSTVAGLAGAQPMRFGNTTHIVFDDFPRAEFVEQGGDKSSTKGGFSTVTATPHKTQVTMRFNEEVLWADEARQIGVLEELTSAAATALSRALDFGIYHAINPLNGAKVETWSDYVGKTTKTVVQGSADADADIRAAAGLLIASSINPTGIALDPKQAWALASLQAKSGGVDTGTPRYPQLGLGTSMDSFLGLNAMVSDTVSGLPEAADTGIRAVVGDFTNGLRWGIQKELPLEIIRYGDPDGQGDLARKNQVALRLELVYGWFVRPDRFAVVKTAG